MNDSAVHARLTRAVKENDCTLLGVGPMSRNCVDATIELAYEHDLDSLMLIASRRQVECAELGGGYVENWSTEEFSDYVKRNDPEGRVLTCRDHGGPWQGSGENHLSIDEAMRQAKTSYMADIQSGFSVIHIDPSVNPTNEELTVETVLERVFELYTFCWETAQKLGKDIVFEIGTEEQDCSTGSLKDLDYVLERINSFCLSEKLPKPLFVVAQTGTKVMEDKNIGTFGSVNEKVDEGLSPEQQIPLVIKKLEAQGMLLKQHNTDYIEDATLSLMPGLGVHAANVAPEFGVFETRRLLALLRQFKLMDLHERFVKLAYDSCKWEKWMLPETSADDYQRAVICGHYVFATEEGRAIKAEAAKRLAEHDVMLDLALKNEVKQAIYRYLVSFNLAQEIGSVQEGLALTG